MTLVAEQTYEEFSPQVLESVLRSITPEERRGTEFQVSFTTRDKYVAELQARFGTLGEEPWDFAWPQYGPYKVIATDMPDNLVRLVSSAK